MSRKRVAPAVGVCVTLALPAQAFAKAVVRFVHAMPAVGRARMSVGGHTVGAIAFGGVVLQHGSAVKLGVYRTHGGKPGTALVRVIPNLILPGTRLTV